MNAVAYPGTEVLIVELSYALRVSFAHQFSEVIVADLNVAKISQEVFDVNVTVMVCIHRKKGFLYRVELHTKLAAQGLFNFGDSI